jgi:hypothetical protein
VSALQVIDVIARCYDITAQSMSIMKVAPEDFLLLWPDVKTADRVLNKGLPLPGPGFTLFFKRWTRLALASGAVLPSSVEIELRGIPAHAWDRSTVQQILKGVCWIQSAHPDSEARRDLSVFRVLAWCLQPNIVLATVNLFIPEATAEVETLLSKRGLAYPLAISVVPGRAGRTKVVVLLLAGVGFAAAVPLGC